MLRILRKAFLKGAWAVVTCGQKTDPSAKHQDAVVESVIIHRGLLGLLIIFYFYFKSDC